MAREERLHCGLCLPHNSRLPSSSHCCVSQFHENTDPLPRINRSSHVRLCVIAFTCCQGIWTGRGCGVKPETFLIIKTAPPAFRSDVLGCGWLRRLQDHACVLSSALSPLTVSPPSEPNFAISGCSGDTNTQTHTVHNNPPSLNLQKLWKIVGKFACLLRHPLAAFTTYVRSSFIWSQEWGGGWGQGAAVGDTSSPNWPCRGEPLG